MQRASYVFVPLTRDPVVLRTPKRNERKIITKTDLLVVRAKGEDKGRERASEAALL